MRSLLLLIFLLPVTLQADELAPFEAEYRVFVSKIPTPVKARLTLEALPGEDEYRIELEARSFLLRTTETSHFTWNDCKPRTSTYRHEFRGFGRRRHHDMTFSWEPPEVHNRDEKDREDTFAIPENTLDELTLLLKARCAFADGATEYLAHTAYGDDLKEHMLEIVEREKIDTPVGELDTLVVRKQRPDSSERTTYFWIAPSLDYLLVKARHVENPALFAELILRDISVQGDSDDAAGELPDTPSEPPGNSSRSGPR